MITRPYSLKQENIEEFRRRFIEAAIAIYRTAMLCQKLMLDAEVQFNQLTLNLWSH